MKEFVEKLIERLEEKAIKTLGVNRSQFAMDKGEYSSYCSLSLDDVKEITKDLASEHNNDFCEWKFVKSVSDGGYFYSSGCSHKRFSDLHSFEFCPYCRKKIKVVK